MAATLTRMEGSNGIKADINHLKGEVDKLWDSRASKESVENLKEGLDGLKKSMDGLGSAFRNLQTSILVGCVLWALGSAGFLIGILEFTNS